MPPNKTLRFVVEVSFEENIGGSWQKVTVRGNALRETLETTFTTGDAPANIPLNNVHYSYPIVDQMNFYKDEYGEGYIKLSKGQDNLLKGKQLGIKLNSSDLVVKATYNEADNLINFEMPKSLDNSKIYNISLSDGDSEAQLLEYHFQTSKYNTFTEKISNMKFSKGWSKPIYTGIHELGFNLSGSEMFDKFEVEGSQHKFRPLIKYEADLENDWYSEDIGPLLYSSRKFTENVEWRKLWPLGAPPKYAVYTKQEVNNAFLGDSDYNSGSKSLSVKNASIIYNLPFVAFKDYSDLRNKAAEYLITEEAEADNYEEMQKLVNSPFPSIKKGKYRVTIKYTLPGTNKVTSEKELMIKL